MSHNLSILLWIFVCIAIPHVYPQCRIQGLEKSDSSKTLGKTTQCFGWFLIVFGATSALIRCECQCLHLSIGLNIVFVQLLHSTNKTQRPIVKPRNGTLARHGSVFLWFSYRLEPNFRLNHLFTFYICSRALWAFESCITAPKVPGLPVAVVVVGDEIPAASILERPTRNTIGKNLAIVSKEQCKSKHDQVWSC